MSNWQDFTKSLNAQGSKPSYVGYLVVKLTDNFLSVSVLLLTILFAVLGLFLIEPSHTEQRNWALDASKLCLGVFLGLLKSTKR